jgi:hypothetical protein
MVQQGESVVVGGGDVGGREQGAVVECLIVLTQGKKAAVEGT